MEEKNIKTAKERVQDDIVVNQIPFLLQPTSILVCKKEFYDRLLSDILVENHEGRRHEFLTYNNEWLCIGHLLKIVCWNKAHHQWNKDQTQPDFYFAQDFKNENKSVSHEERIVQIENEIRDLMEEKETIYKLTQRETIKP